MSPAYGLICAVLLNGTAEGADSTRLAGIVVDERDRPLAGVKVYLSFDGMPPEVHSKAESDDSGQFSVTLPPETNGSFAPPGFALWAYKPGWGVTMEELRRHAMPAGEPIRVVLGPAAQSHFRVLGPNGRPVAGLRIVADALRRGHLHPLPQELADQAAVVTDRAGTAVVTALDHADMGRIRFISAEFGNQEIWGYTRPANEAITLRPVGRIVGRIVSEAPVSGASISLTSQAQQEQGQPNPIRGVAEVVVDARGRFDLPAMVAGNLFGSVVLPPSAAM
ncbi:MAG: hypothetical protein HY000_39120, partial [Planctomycetes bacterium]|nr:hypothetical protein [Planctomycetota bacterium]